WWLTARTWLRLAFSYQMGCPNPAARSVASSGPRPAQQSANVPSITTAGTERIPRLVARRATSGSRMSRIVTSQEGQATRLIVSMASVHTEHAALKISICRLLFMREPLDRCLCVHLQRVTQEWDNQSRAPVLHTLPRAW